ncbi:hypothetical protein NHH03_20970 [Stieleria sp. TO1_6]|uniref:hypothetical protein n=1 Tax=Stieleria tagensis TaxID=2956795 RepID=UPI00209B58E9|nr:hypothetical protein [Stieleria tagensis]MCO8124228.1 hypothetical protein [Stieleria tagensis]
MNNTVITRSRRSRRPGFTLRELTIAMAAGSTIMMTTVGMVHHAFDWSTTARHRRMDDQTFFNLSRQLRGDIHLADQAVCDSDSLELTTADEHLVVYQINGQSISRVETAADDTPVRRENYHWKLPRQLTLQHVESQQQIKLDAKSITPFAESEVPIWRSMKVSIGLRLRHQTGDIES